MVNPDNPCRCARKTAEFVRAGIVDPDRMQFASDTVDAARGLAKTHSRSLRDLVAGGLGGLYRHHPTWSPPDMVRSLRELIGHRKFQEMLSLTPSTSPGLQ